MKKTPIQIVKERFTTKEKLVEAVKQLATQELWLDRLNADKGFEHVSNAKLLRLHALLEDAKKRFGSRDQLITAIQTIEKRSKDAGYKARLSQYPLPRLLDLHAAAERRAKRAEKRSAGSAAPAKKTKQARSKKAKAKARAAA